MPEQQVGPASGGRGEEAPGVVPPPAARHVVVELRPDGTGLVDGSPLTVADDGDPRQQLMDAACRIAARFGRPVAVTAREPGGVWELVAHPDGRVADASDEDAELLAARAAGAPDETPPERSAQAGPTSADQGRPPAPAPSADPFADPFAVPGASRSSAPVPPVPELGPGDRTVTPQDPPDALDRRLAALLGGPLPAAGPAAAPARAPGGLGESPFPRAGAGSPSRRGSAVAPTVSAGGRARRGARPAPLIPASRPGALDPVAVPTTRRADPRLVAAMAGTGVALVFVAVVAALPGARPAGQVVASAAGAAPSGVRTVTGSAGARTPARAVPVTLAGVALPPGHRTTPAWTQPVPQWTRSVASVAGYVLTRTAQGTVVMLGPDDGSVVWSSAERTAADQDGPWLSAVDGTAVAAVVGSGELTYWSLPAPVRGASPSPSAAARQGRGTTVPLPAGARVSWIGSSPLVTAADGTTSVVRAGRLVPVTLPSRARALSADGTSVLAVAGASSVLQPADTAPVAPRPIPAPPGSSGGPARVEAIGGRLLLSVWRAAGGSGQILSLSDAANGKLLVHSPLARGTDLVDAGMLREPGGYGTLLGSVVIDPYTARVDLLDPRYSVRGLNRGHAWATRDGKAVDIHLTATGDFTVVPFGNGTPATPVGVVDATSGRPGVAIIVAPAGDGWALAGVQEV